MGHILYHGAANGPSLTVLAAASEKNVSVECRLIALAAGARHLLAEAAVPEVAMSIEGEGPVLVADGVAMTDSVFIACYLDDIGSGAALRPADPYARWEMMAWCRQIIERLAPAAACLGVRADLTPKLQAMSAADFEKIIAPIRSTDLQQRWREARHGDVSAETLGDCETKVGQAVSKCEAQLQNREWLMGAFSIADLETFAWLDGMRALVPSAFVDAPRTNAWAARVAARPSVVSAKVAKMDSVWAPGPEINRWG